MKAARSVLSHGVLLALGALFFLPFYWLLLTSLKADSEIFASPPVWLPHVLHWDNYARAVSYIPFFLYLRNTVVISVLSVIGSVFSCSLVAYSLAKLQWRGRDALFFLIVATMMLPSQVTMIPVFSIFKKLGWIDTFKPLIVPQFLGTAFYIFLLRQFFLGIPQELSDAARIDGCSELATYWRVILPLAKPALAAVGLFTFMGAWNDFTGPLLYLNDETKATLSLGLQQFVGQHETEWAMLMAASTLMALPMVLLFFLAQRFFIEGITLTGIKG